MDERRWRILWVCQHDAGIIFGHWRECGYVYLRDERLPEDAKLVDVCYDWQRRAFGLRYWSAAFDVVPDGMWSPSFDEAANVMCNAVSLDSIPGISVEKLSPKPGDLITLRYEGGNQNQQQCVQEAARLLAERFDGVQFVVMPNELSTDATKPGHGMDLETENLTTMLWFLRTQMEVHAPHVFDEAVWDAFERRALQPPVIYTYTGSPASKEAAMQAAREKMDNVNIQVQPLGVQIIETDIVAGKLIDPPPGKERWEKGDTLPDLLEPDDYVWQLLEVWKDDDQWSAKAIKKHRLPMAFIMDEATDLPADFWDKLKAMAACTCKSLLAGHEPGCPHAG